jgi:multidrug efflux pump subunit AcrB
MNIPKYSLENSKIIYFFLAVMLIGGVYSFFKLPKKEDAPFVIKQAVLVTQCDSFRGRKTGHRANRT